MNFEIVDAPVDRRERNHKYRTLLEAVYALPEGKELRVDVTEFGFNNGAAFRQAVGMAVSQYIKRNGGKKISFAVERDGLHVRAFLRCNGDSK